MADASDGNRRSFLSRASSFAMITGLAGGYGAFAAIAGRFLYPARPERRQWMFVTEVDRLRVGDSILFRGPAGETVSITRQGGDGVAADFIALSSTCPHLGCQVHWEAHNERFFCPCHNGVFDPSGVGTGGPPGDAGQSLPRYPLRLDGSLLSIEMPVESLTAGGPRVPRGEIVERIASRPGHDPCLNRPCGNSSGGNGRDRGTA